MTYNNNGWKKIFLRLNTNITWIYPEHTEGPMSQLVIHKLHIINEYRTMREHVHVFLYLCINTALESQSPESKDSIEQNQKVRVREIQINPSNSLKVASYPIQSANLYIFFLQPYHKKTNDNKEIGGSQNQFDRSISTNLDTITFSSKLMIIILRLDDIIRKTIIILMNLRHTKGEGIMMLMKLGHIRRMRIIVGYEYFCYCCS